MSQHQYIEFLSPGEGNCRVGFETILIENRISLAECAKLTNSIHYQHINEFVELCPEKAYLQNMHATLKKTLK